MTNESRRYAFIEYRRTREADRAYSEAHNTLLDGRRILVDRELGRTVKNWKPRRYASGYKDHGSGRFSGPGRGFDHHRGPPLYSRDHHRPSYRPSRSAPYPRRSNGYTHLDDDHFGHSASRSIYSNGDRSSYRHSGGGPIHRSRR